MKKLLIAAVVLIVVVLLFPSGQSKPSGDKSKLFGMTPKSTKKTSKDSLIKEEDLKVTAKDFDPLDASLKNSFIPKVTKADTTPADRRAIPASFAAGESGWIYTGNMTVNGTPNALLENTASGQGVFLRPGQHWKNLRLVTVRDDSIVLEGPNGETKTVYFEDVTALTASVDSLPPLPVAVPANQDGNNNRNNGNRRADRQMGGQMADNSGMAGPIGSGSAFDTSIDSQDQQNNNRRNRNRRNNENSLN